MFPPSLRKLSPRFSGRRLPPRCQSPEYGAVGGHHSNAGAPLQIHDGRIWLNLPPCCTMYFVHTSV
jgi:hypothetical protein